MDQQKDDAIRPDGRQDKKRAETELNKLKTSSPIYVQLVGPNGDTRDQRPKGDTGEQRRRVKKRNKRSQKQNKIGTWGNAADAEWQEYGGAPSTWQGIVQHN